MLSAAVVIASASVGSASGVDASAIEVSLEPGADVSSVQIDVSDAARRSLTLDATRLSFSVRRIGQAALRAVATIPPAPTPTLGPDAQGGMTWFGLRLALPELAPGPYELSMSVGDGFAKSSDGTPMPVDVPQARSRALNLYFPAVRAPGVGVGTRFLATGQTKDAAVGQIWSVTRVDAHDGYRTLTLEHTGDGLLPRATRVRIDEDEMDGDGYGPFAQLVDDPVATRLTQQYAGKPLWTFGRYVFTCRDPNGWGEMAEPHDRAPLQIKAIYRIRERGTRLPLGSDDPYYFCSGGCHQSYHVITDEPLVAIFAPKTADLRMDPPRVITHIWMYRGPCVSGQGMFLDDWAFERVFSTDDPHTVDPEWPASFRDDLLAYRFVPGMSHRMVAWAAGYPSTFGTAAQLEKLSAWDWYPGPTPTSASFDGDAVQGFGGSWGP